jgi:5-methylcytosine-specific restriction protein A
MRKPPKIRLARPLLQAADHRTTLPPPKQADPELLTAEHRAWALAVKRRAGWKCEDCGAQGGRGGVVLYADHIIERSDGGALYDLDNSRCRCGSCHSTKTADARARRHGLR